MQGPSISRPPPPQVDPVVHNGVRYEQVKDALALGYGQLTGHLMAVDPASGKRLWVVKVYDAPPDPNVEGDVQAVYFSRMELIPGKNQLLIENEAKRRFIVDLDDRSVAAAE